MVHRPQTKYIYLHAGPRAGGAQAESRHEAVLHLLGRTEFCPGLKACTLIYTFFPKPGRQDSFGILFFFFFGKSVFLDSEKM